MGLLTGVGGWRLYLLAAAAGALLLGVAAGAIRWYGHSQYEAGKKDCEEAQRVAGLEAFKETAERLSGISQNLADTTEKLTTAQPTVIQRYTREIVQTPLPAGCVRDPGRVRATNDAIDAANAARQPGAAVPAGASR